MSERVVVAMSGGVDSSVAALLLKEQGYEPVGIFMRNGVEHPVGKQAEPGGPARKQGCCSVRDAYDARRVADQLEIPFYAVNFHREFQSLIDHFVSEYDRGRTPNPCIRCNQNFKLGKIFEYADLVGARWVATGHYARLEQTPGGPRLYRAKDLGKDQSYVLFIVPADRLARTLFPLGKLTKQEVREVAREAGLRVSQKPDSQEICFVPDQDYGGLLRKHIPDRLRPGPIRTVDGPVVGEHPGYQYFTVGQRKGLRVALGRPAYVVEIRPEDNTVVVGYEDDNLRHGLLASGFLWLQRPSSSVFPANAKIRSMHPGSPCTVTAAGNGAVKVVFDRPERAITPGQAIVLYEGDLVLGGGWIDRSLTENEPADLLTPPPLPASCERGQE